MKRTMFAIYFGICAFAASAQAPPQPVKGICEVTWDQAEGVKQCTMHTTPKGKRLLVKQIYSQCSGRNGDSFGTLRIASSSWEHAGIAFVPVPNVEAPALQRVAAISLQQNAEPGQSLRAEINFVGTASKSSPPKCTISMTGSLENLQ